MSKRVCLALLVLLAASVSAQALEIIYPADRTYVPRSDFLILKGGGQPPLDALVVIINGTRSDLIDISAAEYKAAFGDLLILEPEFDSGKNVVEAEGYVKGRKVDSARAEIHFLPTPGASPPPGVARFVMHLPEKEKLCAGCHNMNPSKSGLAAPNPQKNPCASCHQRMMAKKFVHGPAGVWSCTYCHNADSKPAKYQPRDGDAKVCNECHADKVKEFKGNKFVHGPIEAGMCSVCHDPHASGHGAQLYAPINELCLGCHAPVGNGIHVVRGVGGKGHPLDKVYDPSRPGHHLSCTGCHDPHGGKSPALFQKGVDSRFTLCQLCHQK